MIVPMSITQLRRGTARDRPLLSSILVIACVLLILTPRVMSFAQSQPPNQPKNEAGDDVAPATPPKPLSLEALVSPLSEFPIRTAFPSFTCENVGFMRVTIPRSMVVDGVCDCCDGSDERVEGGRNPFFPQYANDLARWQQKQEERMKVQQKEESESGWDVLNMLSGKSEETSGEEKEPEGPCPNTCATTADGFLHDFQQKIDAYAAGVNAKQERMKQFPDVLRSMRLAKVEAGKRLQHAVQHYRRARHMFESYPQESTHVALMHAQSQAALAQRTLDDLKWMLGQASPMPNDRSVQRPTAWFGAAHEWLLLFNRCMDYEWRQRKFGEFGDEGVDRYLVRLCPLHNATQTTMPDESNKDIERSTVSMAKEQNDADDGGETSKSVENKDVMNDEDDAGDERITADADEQDASSSSSSPQTFVLGRLAGDIKPIKQAPAPSTRSSSSSSTSPPGSFLAPSAEPMFRLSLRGGEPCWQVGPREADVTFTCHVEDRVLELRENGKCKYEIMATTPVACDQSYLERMRKQWKEYQTWFQRKPNATINAAPVLTAQLLQDLHDEL